MRNANIKIAPSILSADFAKMGEEVALLERSGADIIHCDVMDGVFVPNLTFGIKMIEDVKKRTNLPLDCHLMIVNPEKYVERFAKAGADYITVHVEACGDNTRAVLEKINSLGVKSGVVINPDTPAEKIADLLPLCDMVVVMSVFPGFGGQSFISGVLDKVRVLRKLIDEQNKKILIEIDGGVNPETAKAAISAGVDVLVAGNTVFKADDKAAMIEILRNA